MNNLKRYLKKIPYIKKIWYLVNFSDLIWFYKTSAPISIYISYLKIKYLKINITHIYVNQVSLYQKTIAKLDFSNDWFTMKIPYWIYIFNTWDRKNKKINILEIGSWEGMSALFLLNFFPQSSITCIDTWEGADEHKIESSRFNSELILKQIEKKFDKNLSGYKDRILKYKGCSKKILVELNESDLYDLIYIDGSHYVNDVMIDAILSFDKLKDGGIMIFDDYIWNYYLNPLDNPAGAINSFLKLKKNSYKILATYNQVILQKKGHKR